MSGEGLRDLEKTWAGHHAQWRDSQQVIGHWEEGAKVDPSLFHCRVDGQWWETLARLDATLVVSREYEHLLMALSVVEGKPRQSFLPLPHPTGLVVDRRRNALWVACTRNPNQITCFRPLKGFWDRLDVALPAVAGNPLLPTLTRYYAGSLYLHDLALIGGVLHGNAVGQNAVVRFGPDEAVQRVWWPQCIDTPRGPLFSRNHLQLNGIAAGNTLQESYFCASSDQVQTHRPGSLKWRVDGRGVIFSGASREVVCRGLTRPHSPRLHQRRLWVNNSGYGELGVMRSGRFEPLVKLPGWTRGLCLIGDVAVVGVSRVIPRFAVYAPGLEPQKSLCGLFAVCLKTGKVLGSLLWPNGNQIFALDWFRTQETAGFPRAIQSRRLLRAEKHLYYAYKT